MARLPSDLGRLALPSLVALDRSYDRALKHEIDRICRGDVRFRRVLGEALVVEAELERRGERT